MVSVAFECASCRRPVGDPLYRGPAGHAPRDLCLDCWADEWAHIEVRMLNGGDWQVLDAALWLVCNGFSRQEAAGVIGVHRNTIGNWLKLLRENPAAMPEWFSLAMGKARGGRPSVRSVP